MQIGEILKTYRLKNNKTQKKWISGIVSPSFYSKVENNEHRISADDLLKILRKNNINISEFFSFLESTEQIFSIYNDKIVSAFFNKDINYLTILSLEILRNENLSNDEQIFLKSLIQCVIADISNDYSIIENSTVTYLKNKFFSLENWGLFKLTLYANIINLYDINSNNEIISSMMKKDFHYYSEEQRDAILVILINFISTCISHNYDELAIYYLKQIDKIEPTISNTFQKIIAMYYYHLINYRHHEKEEDKNKIENVINLLSLLGYKEFSKTLNNFFYTIINNDLN